MSSQHQQQETKQSLNFEYNNRTEQSYLKKGLKAPDTLDFQEKYFLGMVEGDITRVVNKIVRIKAPDLASKKREQKEFLYWYEEWNGKDWQTKKVPPVTDHIEGFYWEQETEPIIKQNKKVGEKRTGQHKVYYVPFSKKAIDEIIARSETAEDQIKLCVKTERLRSDEFTYDQFVNSSYEECIDMMRTNGGPVMYAWNEQKKKQQTVVESKTSK